MARFHGRHRKVAAPQNPRGPRETRIFYDVFRPEIAEPRRRVSLSSTVALVRRSAFQSSGVGKVPKVAQEDGASRRRRRAPSTQPEIDAEAWQAEKTNLSEAREALRPCAGRFVRAFGTLPTECSLAACHEGAERAAPLTASHG